MNYYERKTDRVKKSRNLTAAINVTVFVVILILGFILIMFMPKPTVSEYERRELAKFPEFSAAALFNGEYADGINMFVADTFPFRDSFVSANAYFDEIKGIRFDDVKFYSGTEGFPVVTGFEEPVIERRPPVTTALENIPNQNQEPTEAPLEDEVPPEEPPPPPERIELEGEGEYINNVFVIGDVGLELFGGVSSIGENYAHALNNYRALLPDSVNIYNIIIPTHSEFALPQKYRSMASSQKNAIDNIHSFITDGIKSVNIYDRLLRHQNEYIYFRTDHHWTALGAYYAYLEFAAAAGIEPIDREDLEHGKVETFYGSFYTWTRDINMRNNPDFVEYFRPHDVADYDVISYLSDGTVYHGSLVARNAWDDTSGYLIFINGDQPHTHIITPNKNGRKLIVFKESFGNAFVPFAAMHYEEIHVADIRYFPYNAVSFINEKEIDDVIFINNIFAAYTQARINNINNLVG